MGSLTTLLIIIMLIATTACSSVGIQSSTMYNANAQSMILPPSPSSEQQPSANLSASISIIPTLVEAIKSKIQVDLNNATTVAMNSVGENSTAVLASIQPERGYLIYKVIVLDNNNNVYMVLIDPANGKIVSKQQLPLEIMRTILNGLPLASSQFGRAPDFIGP
jgi:hypothetical protein